MKYQANPVIVDAVKIVEIGEILSDGSKLLKFDADIEVADGPVSFLQATNEMLCRIPNLAVGDLAVRQEDGYVYLNPAAVFERKYSPFVEGPDPREVRIADLVSQNDALQKAGTNSLDQLDAICAKVAELNAQQQKDAEEIELKAARIIELEAKLTAAAQLAAMSALTPEAPTETPAAVPVAESEAPAAQ